MADRSKQACEHLYERLGERLLVYMTRRTHNVDVAMELWAETWASAFSGRTAGRLISFTLNLPPEGRTAILAATRDGFDSFGGVVQGPLPTCAGISSHPFLIPAYGPNGTPLVPPP